MTEALTVRKAGAVAIHQDALPTINQTMQHYNLVQEVLAHVMKEGTHYGPGYPGDTKKNLLKPGADSLGVAFQLVPMFEVEERDLGAMHREYRVTATVKTRSGAVVATGVGTCSTLETKYRWRQATRKCPHCGKAAIIKGKEEYGGGWVCFKKKDGCGTAFQDGDKSIEGQTTERQENTDPADCWNTCLKIGKKRAYVDAMITATGASDMFTQDAEDFRDAAPAPAPVVQSPPPKPAQPQGQKVPLAGAPASKPEPLQADPAEAVDVVALGASLQKATTMAELTAKWQVVLGVQGDMPPKDLVGLMAIKRAMEAALSKGGK